MIYNNMLDYYGIREVMDVTLRAKEDIPACSSITGKDIKKGEPVVFFERLKISDLKRNSVNNKQMTLHIEEALISPTSMALLMNAITYNHSLTKTSLMVSSDNILKWDSTTEQNFISLSKTKFNSETFVDFISMKVKYYNPNEALGLVTQHVSAKDIKLSKATNNITVFGIPGQITEILDLTILYREENPPRKVYKHEKFGKICDRDGELKLPKNHIIMVNEDHPLYVFKVNQDGSMKLIHQQCSDLVMYGPDMRTNVVLTSSILHQGNEYVVDYYREIIGSVTSLVVTADATSDFYLLEGETIMRREADGQDVPVMITMPKVKIRNPFEIAMSANGDPSTFSFVFDAYPDEYSDYPHKDIITIIDIIKDDCTDNCNNTIESKDTIENRFTNYSLNGQQAAERIRKKLQESKSKMNFFIPEEKLKAALKITHEFEIQNMLIPFIKGLSHNDKIRLSQLAIKESIIDLRILTAIEEHTGINVIKEIIAKLEKL